MDAQLQISFPVPDTRASQNAKILAHLQRGEKLTPIDCLNLVGSLRASGRIYDLRHGVFDGTEYPIEKEMITTPSGARVAEYYLESERRDDRS